ncbi:phage shock protein C (PspC) family protein [Ancylomarina subtilis]|uniref:Phage shock protein C (PspC) family protein n=1 Tax=Ancylomarina subtilis TaxID=1639035 RepID=A0A4Q7VM33_9BACT|nr:PspC domain-containing protein [Ancylomarina subtilis]RZT97322.1 phage shock protein C (PspC) family protein [Ancylomarina subtilis]
MKKTFTINISGSIFHIDEDAYDKLQTYLRSINAHYGSSEEGREIIADIESRIAEIFNEKLSSKDQVVTELMIDEVITIMGQPEEIFEVDSEEVEDDYKKQNVYKRRRLFRDPDHRVFGGVASGLSAYFGIDVVVIRLIFVLLFIFGYGSSFLLYIILWIVVPKATTTAQKLEMKGERVNISNIEKSIKDEYEEVKKNFDNMREKRGPQVRDGFDKGVDFAGSALRLVLKVILIILGLGLIIAGIVSLLTFLGSLIFTTSVVGPFANMHFSGMMMPEMLFTGMGIKLFSLGLTLVIGIPLLLLIFVGIKLLVKFKTNNKAIGLTALALWLGGIVLLISVSLTQVKSYIGSGTTYANTEILDNFDGNTLYLRSEKNIDFNWQDENFDFDGVKIIVKDDEKLVVGEPTLDVEKSNSGNFELIMKKKSRGRNHQNAIDNAEEIKYTWKQVDSLLIFDQYFTLPEGDKWRNQKLMITLKVPEGKAVYLDKSVNTIIHDIENTSNTWDGDMIGKRWVMKKEGLTLSRN